MRQTTDPNQSKYMIEALLPSKKKWLYKFGYSHTVKYYVTLKRYIKGISSIKRKIPFL